MYFWNAGLGLIMLLAAGVAALVMQNDLREFIAMVGDALPVMPIAALVMGFCLCTSAVAAPSISLEGKYLWILREAPVDEKSLLWIKTGFELLLSLPCTVVGGVCLAIALRLSVPDGAVLLGLAFPKLDAVNETVVVKQGMAVVLDMFVPMAVLGVCALLYWLGGMIAPAAALALPIALLAVLTAVCTLLLAKKGPAMLRAL